MTCGIYAITNKKTGKKYIGQSKHIERRFKQHCNSYQTNYSYIDRSIQLYGSDAFDFEILYECSVDDLNTEEKKFIALYDTYNNGYNLTPGGTLNIMHTPEIRKKISESKKGHAVSLETRIKISNSLNGNTVPLEVRRKISATLKGVPKSEESKQKMSLAQMGDKNNNYRKHPSLSTSISRSKKTTSTGFFRVTVEKRRNNKLQWIYTYRENWKRKRLTSLCLKKLKENVLNNGLDWIVLDEEKAKNTLMKYGYGELL